MRKRISIRFILVLVLTFAICFAWFVDHQNQEQRIQTLEKREFDQLLDIFDFSDFSCHRQNPSGAFLGSWSPADFHKIFESKINELEGSFDRERDYPTNEALIELADELENSPTSEKVLYIEFLAYLEAENRKRSRSHATRPYIVAAHRVFEQRVRPVLIGMLNDTNADVRGASAVFLAVIGYDREATLAIFLAHQIEQDIWAKERMSWALSHLLRRTYDSDESFLSE